MDFNGINQGRVNVVEWVQEDKILVSKQCNRSGSDMRLPQDLISMGSRFSSREIRREEENRVWSFQEFTKEEILKKVGVF